MHSYKELFLNVCERRDMHIYTIHAHLYTRSYVCIHIHICAQTYAHIYIQCLPRGACAEFLMSWLPWRVYAPLGSSLSQPFWVFMYVYRLLDILMNTMHIYIYLCILQDMYAYLCIPAYLCTSTENCCWMFVNA